MFKKYIYHEYSEVPSLLMELNCIQRASVAVDGSQLYFVNMILVSLCTGGDGVSILSAITLATDIAKVFDVIWLDGEDDDWSLSLTDDVVDTVVDTCVFVTDDVTVVCDDVTAGGDFRFFSGSGFVSFWAWDCFTDSGTFYGVYNLWLLTVQNDHRPMDPGQK